MPPELPRINVRVATLASIAAALVIALRQLDGLIGQGAGAGAHGWTPTRLTGLGADSAGWRSLFADPQLEGLLNGYALLDGVFILVYGALLLGWLRSTPGTAGSRAVVVGMLADAVESALIGLGVGATALPWVSCVKWAGLGLGVLIGLRRGWPGITTGFRYVPAGLYTHRYSVLLALPIVALGLGSGPAILEQVPDLQRRWADGGAGPGHLFAAGGVTGVLTLAAFVLGRQRSDLLFRRSEARVPTPDEPRSPLLIWFLVPTLLVGGAVIAEVSGGSVGCWRVALMCAIPLVIGGGSLCRRWRGIDISARRQRREIAPDRFRRGALIGDVVPGILLLVTCLALVRAFTAVIATGAATTFGWVLLGLGCLGTALVWPAYTRLVDQVAVLGNRSAHAAPDSGLRRFAALLVPGLTSDASQRQRGGQWLSWTVLAGSVTLGLLLGGFEDFLGSRIGVLAALQWGWGALCLAVAAVVVLLQRGGAPEIFWRGGLLPMAFVPVTSLAVLTLFVGSLGGLGADVHAPRPLPTANSGTSVDARPTLDAEFDTWLAAPDRVACSRPVGGGMVARPLLMYAAEGGGIRAAYWTTAALDLIGEQTRTPTGASCGRGLVSSGASGGSVGLTLASLTPTGTARRDAIAISGPPALSRAMIGLTVRDTLFAAAGVPIGPYRDRDSAGYRWADRAALIEETWEREVPALGTPWLTGAPAGLPGRLVLNATSTTTGCRALVSQIRWESTGGRDVDCRTGAVVPGSVDLLACLGEVRASTAALMSSRFPYVTPSAAVRCGSDGGSTQQVVDGGYAENTGIGTLVDLMPTLLARVRTHNECVLAGTGRTSSCATAPRTLVVPMLVYLANGPGPDLVRKPPRGTPELFVPPLTSLKARATLYSASSQLQRAEAALAPLTSGEDPTAALFTQRVFVVNPADRTGIAAPLGWVLSRPSRAPMDRALQGLLTRERTSTHLHHGNLRELLESVRPVT